MENIDIGKKVEKFRKEKGYSSRELAKIADITPSMLSQIERGLANPSIQTLKVLAKALDVPTFSFLLEETNTEDLVVRYNERKKWLLKTSPMNYYPLILPGHWQQRSCISSPIPPLRRNFWSTKGKRLLMYWKGKSRCIWMKLITYWKQVTVSEYLLI